MSASTVMSLVNISQNFPEASEPEIVRDNIIEAIETNFASGTEIMLVEGEEGIGKSTLLAQFTKRHQYHAISIYIVATNWMAYDPGTVLFDLGNQIEWVLRRKELEPSQEFGPAHLLTNINELQRRARRNGEVYYFVVDGLHTIPDQDVEIRRQILDLLPFGRRGFRFLMSGDDSLIPETVQMRTRCKAYLVPGFSFDESVRFFGDLNIEKADVEDVHRTCRGVPMYLASARRIMESEGSARGLLDSMPTKLPELFNIEWRHVDPSDELQIRILALLAHDPRSYTLADIGTIFDVAAEAIKRHLEPLRFIKIAEESGEVSFTTDAFRRYASAHLKEFKGEIDSLLINVLSNDPESETALTYLPTYLTEANRYEDLISYLSSARMTGMLKRVQSFAPIQRKADLGMQAAIKLHRDGDLLRFGMQKSALSGIDRTDLWRHEIEARMTLDDYATSVAVAQAAMVKEDRLHLLATIARIQSQQGLVAEQELIEQIHTLYQDIDKEALGERGVEIAADLMFVDPAMAIELVQLATNTEADEHALDWAFAKLSALPQTGTKELDSGNDTANALASRIRHPGARRLAARARVLMGRYSPDGIIEETQRLQTTGDKLFMLRQWALHNSSSSHAAKVLEYGLNLAVTATAYTPNPRDLRELFSPIDSIENPEVTRQLIRAADSQRGILQASGPSVEYVGLQLLLSRAESRYDANAAENRLIEIYLVIGEIEDIAVKAECLSLFITTTAKMVNSGVLNLEDKLSALRDLRQCLDRIWSTTAEHYQATKGVIRALAIEEPKLALDICLAANTEYRRDEGLFALIKAWSANSSIDLVEEYSLDVISKIVNPLIRGEAISRLISQIMEDVAFDAGLPSWALALIGKIPEIWDSRARCLAYCNAYIVITRIDASKWAALGGELLSDLKSTWSGIDIEWQRADIGFEIAIALAQTNRTTADEYLRAAVELRERFRIASDAAASVYMTELRLTVQAFSGLMDQKLDTDEDGELLQTLIDFIPSRGERAAVWADLAIRYRLRRRPDMCNRIVTERVWPLITSFSDQDVAHRVAVGIFVAPALYFSHPTTAIEFILTLPDGAKDAACVAICDAIFTKQPPFDAYDSATGQVYKVAYDEFVDICKLLEHVELDLYLYMKVQAIADTMASRANRDVYTQGQKNDIASRLETLISQKLPNNRFITHNGYRIACLAQVCRMRQTGPAEWVNLISEARAIPNLSDCAYVLGIIATAIPSRESNLRRELINESLANVGAISVDLDRSSRYDGLASQLMTVDVSLAKECWRLALNAIKYSDDEVAQRTQRRIVDQAYSCDPDFAAGLVDALDQDSARTSLKRRLESLRIKSKMSDPKQRTSGDAIASHDLAQNAWMLLGALRAGRLTTIAPEEMRRYLARAGGLPPAEAYPVFAWAIENALVRFANTDQARIYLRPLFDAMTDVLAFVKLIMARSSSEVTALQQTVRASRSSQGTLIRIGERERALAAIQDWVAQNVQDYLKICDPFFGPEDLELLRLVQSLSPLCDIQILTSKAHHDAIEKPWKARYESVWHTLSVQDPPNTKVVIVGSHYTGALPIHDRWWLTRDAGLRTGTSFSSLGMNRESEITRMSAEEAAERERDVDQYLNLSKREQGGERLVYEVFTL